MATFPENALAGRQLQLDAAVAAEGFFCAVFVERLKLAEAGGDEMRRRYALGDEVAHDRDGAACRACCEP